MKRILLPTDFSSSAWNAIEFAMKLFKDETCKFYILHTYTPALYRLDYLLGGPNFSAIPDSEVELSIKGLEKTVRDMKRLSQNPKHQFEMVSAFNILSHEVNDQTITKNIDLIVMGTKGATGAKEVFIGSNTVYVLRKATVPVLVIPENASLLSIKKILFPTDFLTKYKEHEFQKISEMAERFHASIVVVHVVENYKLSEGQLKNKEHLSRLLKNIPHTFVELTDDLMPFAIFDYLEEASIDLLAMMNKKHSLVERIFERQHIDQVGYHVKTPFLVVQDTAKVNTKATISVD
ncbi:MAG: universal stress protein [Eudoraea sp.]|nr:universal stress protein [Eudoraea sp.]